MTPAVALFLVSLLLVAAGSWLLIRGGRAVEMYDDEPQTLDVQNHRGDE